MDCKPDMAIGPSLYIKKQNKTKHRAVLSMAVNKNIIPESIQHNPLGPVKVPTKHFYTLYINMHVQAKQKIHHVFPSQTHPSTTVFILC